MDTLEMFPDMPSNPTRMEAWKERYGVWTAFSDMGEGAHNWMAIIIPKAHEMLNGYDLTQEEKEDPWTLFYGYCRLLDEAGLCQTGETELEACQAIAQRWQLIGV